MPDVIESLGGSLIQHGNLNQRIYVMRLDPADCPDIITALRDLALARRYTKTFAKVPESLSSLFLDQGYSVEARVPGFFQGQIQADFLAFYLDEKRKIPARPGLIQEVIDQAEKKHGQGLSSDQNGSWRIEPMTRELAEPMAELYARVFQSYPFPIHDAEYLRETMQNHVIYLGARNRETLGALASAEMDRTSLCAEMSDFACLPCFRGHNLSVRLLEAMIFRMNQEGIRTLYSIARSVSYGMNIAFAKTGFCFGGTLINNTHISGGLESMNVWYKHL